MSERDNEQISNSLKAHIWLWAIVIVLLALGTFWFVGDVLLGASARSPISQVRGDMRSMATYIESYLVENQWYPPCTYDPEKKILGFQPDRVPTFMQQINLTTPVQYIGLYPRDIFSDSGESTQTFGYWTTGRSWMLVSPGPDNWFDTDFERFERYATTIKTRADGTTVMFINDRNYANTYVRVNAYDSTNGTKSAGDIYHISSGQF